MGRLLGTFMVLAVLAGCGSSDDDGSDESSSTTTEAETTSTTERSTTSTTVLPTQGADLTLTTDEGWIYDVSVDTTSGWSFSKENPPDEPPGTFVLHAARLQTPNLSVTGATPGKTPPNLRARLEYLFPIPQGVLDSYNNDDEVLAPGLRCHPEFRADESDPAVIPNSLTCLIPEEQFFSDGSSDTAAEERDVYRGDEATIDAFVTALTSTEPIVHLFIGGHQCSIYILPGGDTYRAPDSGTCIIE